MINLSEREHFLHLKFIDKFFVGKTTLLRKKHIELMPDLSVFLPCSTQKKDEKKWHPATGCTGVSLRKGRWTTSLS